MCNDLAEAMKALDGKKTVQRLHGFRQVVQHVRLHRSLDCLYVHYQRSFEALYV